MEYAKARGGYRGYVEFGLRPKDGFEPKIARKTATFSDRVTSRRSKTINVVRCETGPKGFRAFTFGATEPSGFFYLPPIHSALPVPEVPSAGLSGSSSLIGDLRRL